MNHLALGNRIAAKDFAGTWEDLLGGPALPDAAAVFCQTQLEGARAAVNQLTSGGELLIAQVGRAEESLIQDLQSLGLSVIGAPEAFDAVVESASPVERGLVPQRVWLLTSGTTGRPKHIAHTLESLTTVKGQQEPRTWLCPYTPGAYAWWQIVTLGLQHPGQDIVFVDSDDLDNWPALALEHGVTAASGTPTFWRQSLVRSGEAIAKLDMLQITLGGEPVDQAILDQLRGLFPKARISWIYASSEAGAAIAVHDGLAGFPEQWLDSTDDSRPTLSVAGVELVISSPNRGEGISQRLHTGDRVERVDGRVQIVGRIVSDEINVGGSKASASNVRSVLLQHPAVAWASVRGRRAPIVGTMVTAEVVLKPGSAADEAELAAHARRLLPEYAVPRRMRILDEIPMKESLKTDV